MLSMIVAPLLHRQTWWLNRWVGTSWKVAHWHWSACVLLLLLLYAICITPALLPYIRWWKRKNITSEDTRPSGGGIFSWWYLYSAIIALMTKRSVRAPCIVSPRSVCMETPVKRYPANNGDVASLSLTWRVSPIWLPYSKQITRPTWDGMLHQSSRFCSDGGGQDLPAFLFSCSKVCGHSPKKVQCRCPIPSHSVPSRAIDAPTCISSRSSYYCYRPPPAARSNMQQ